MGIDPNKLNYAQAQQIVDAFKQSDSFDWEGSIFSEEAPVISYNYKVDISQVSDLSDQERAVVKKAFEIVKNAKASDMEKIKGDESEGLNGVFIINITTILQADAHALPADTRDILTKILDAIRYFFKDVSAGEIMGLADEFHKKHEADNERMFVVENNTLPKAEELFAEKKAERKFFDNKGKSLNELIAYIESLESNLSQAERVLVQENLKGHTTKVIDLGQVLADLENDIKEYSEHTLSSLDEPLMLVVDFLKKVEKDNIILTNKLLEAHAGNGTGILAEVDEETKEINKIVEELKAVNVKIEENLAEAEKYINEEIAKLPSIEDVLAEAPLNEQEIAIAQQKIDEATRHISEEDAKEEPDAKKLEVLKKILARGIEEKGVAEEEGKRLALEVRDNNIFKLKSTLAGYKAEGEAERLKLLNEAAEKMEAVKQLYNDGREKLLEDADLVKKIQPELKKQNVADVEGYKNVLKIAKEQANAMFKANAEKELAKASKAKATQKETRNELRTELEFLKWKVLNEIKVAEEIVDNEDSQDEQSISDDEGAPENFNWDNSNFANMSNSFRNATEWDFNNGQPKGDLGDLDEYFRKMNMTLETL